MISYLLRERPIQSQPTNHTTATVFQAQGNEQIVRNYLLEEGCSKCGPKTMVTLTNNRLLTRYQEGCSCCATQNTDTAIFLHDIECIRAGKNEVQSCYVILLAFLTGTCLCLLCSCFCEKPRRLQLKGGFGEEWIGFRKQDIDNAANEISAYALQFKSTRAGF